MTNKAIVIAGPTGSGKSGFAVELAEKLIKNSLPAEIINADSMQVYNELKVLTAQPTAEQCMNVPHNMYSVISPDQKMNVVVWNKMATKILDELQADDIIPIIVGGTGFYINSLIDGIPQIPEVLPEIREYAKKTLEIYGRDEFYKKLLRIDYRIENKISKNDTQRILRAFEVYKATGQSILSFSEKIRSDKPQTMLQYVISIDRNDNLKRIDTRLHDMIDQGVIEEIEDYNKQFKHVQSPLDRALGYHEFCNYIEGKISLNDAISLTNISSRQYAKRQVTWFKHKLPNAYRIVPTSQTVNDVFNYIVNAED